MKIDWSHADDRNFKSDYVPNDNPRILIAILAHDAGSYSTMKNAALNTCYGFPKYHPHVYPFFVHGNDRKHFSDRKILHETDGQPWVDLTTSYLPNTFGTNIPRNYYYNVPESRYTLLSKTVGFFESALMTLEQGHLGFQWDFIYRTTLGSYVDTHKLHKLCADLPKEKIYYGAKSGPFPEDKAASDRFSYASGSGILMSRDVVGHIVKNKDALNYNGDRIVKPWHGDDPQKDVVLDDVEIGRVVKDYCELTHSPLVDVSIDQIIDPGFEINDNDFHYHFMSSGNPECFMALHRKLLTKKADR